MKNYVNEKIIVITGAGSGFGKLTSEMAAEMGGKIICADINEESLKIVVEGIKAKGGQAEYIVTDASVKSQMDDMAKFALDTYGRIDVLINNAGIMPLAYYADHENAWEAWEKCIDINMKGVLYGTIAVYDQMIKQDQGQIINISSIYANYPVVGGAVYEATKAAVITLTGVLRQEARGVIKTSVVKPTGVPATGLGGSVVNQEAITGALGQFVGEFFESFNTLGTDEMDPGLMDVNSIKYFTLHPEAIAENIIYCINQPWGVNISDITVRASGESYML
ncbi:MAG: SDR family oxidoreductase [Desulfobacterales bacterium]|jgi:NADP-dependent 3-hydroxy acid dehydrogenase YdfG|nr:SDR family oxidoreductase [Desulfobacteraceae bacterium]MBT4363706.1 SDR family oxidoreductase [Desulfobacteraceae bacterium]MBT7085774.1 SDR family oxidoreductase [Desulfobacterales bacterium]